MPTYFVSTTLPVIIFMINLQRFYRLQIVDEQIVVHQLAISSSLKQRFNLKKDLTIKGLKIIRNSNGRYAIQTFEKIVPVERLTLSTFERSYSTRIISRREADVEPG